MPRLDTGACLSSISFVPFLTRATFFLHPSLLLPARALPRRAASRSKRGTLSRLLLLRILAVSALCTIGMLISLFVTTTACHRRRATSVASVAFFLQPVSDVKCELSTIPPCSSTRIEETTEVGSRLSATRPPRETRGPSQAPSFEALFSTSPRFSRLSTSPQAWPRSPPPFPGVGRRTPPAES